MSRDWIEEKAGRLAEDLDNGGGRLVAEKLRQDSIRLPQDEFARLVHTTQMYEQRGYGDDLVVTPVHGYHGQVDQQVSVNLNERDQRGRQYRDNVPAGRIEFPPVYNEHYQRGLDGRSAVAGGAAGLVLGMILERQLDRHRDNRRNNDHGRDDRGRHHDNDDYRRDDRRYHHDNNRHR